MKIKFATLITIFSFCLFTNHTHAQIEKGSMIIEPFYGYSLSGGILKLYETSDATNTTVKHLGPMGFRFEYMVSDLIGLGIDAVYKKSEISYNIDNYSESYTIPKTFIMARMNFHFVRTETVDYYFGYGIGYKMGSYTFESDDPNAVEVSSDVLIPIAFRVSTGFRYFFTEMIGASVELGIGGGSLATFGTVFKF